MNLSEAAKYLGVPQAQLIRWAGFNVGPSYVSGHPIAPQTLVYDKKDLEEWLEEQGHGG